MTESACVSAKPPGTKNFSAAPYIIKKCYNNISIVEILGRWHKICFLRQLTPEWSTVTTPGLSSEIIGEWFAVTPYSPAEPGKMTLSTTFCLYTGACGVLKFNVNCADATASTGAANARRQNLILVRWINFAASIIYKLLWFVRIANICPKQLHKTLINVVEKSNKRNIKS